MESVGETFSFLANLEIMYVCAAVILGPASRWVYGWHKGEW